MSVALVESIRIEGGQLQLLPLHEARMLRTLGELAPEGRLLTMLKQRGLFVLLEAYLPEHLPEARTKLRFVYGADTMEPPTLTPYQPREIGCIRPVSLPDGASYRHKWLDRSVLVRPEALATDEEPLYVVAGRITDTSYTNVALRIGGLWRTPASPLLAGVMRAHLLEQGLILPEVLTPDDLERADAIRLFNAMMPLEDCIEINLSH
ncbi:MAG: aminotransferase class IV [Porphyromonadaceae bacterium]|nr:aminotransferase class IV [Porphyromonadaceae bacterium]